MKKLILLYILSSLVFFSKAQTPNVFRSSPVVTVSDARLRAALNFGIPVVADTLNAVQGGNDSVGLMIYVRVGARKGMWYRDTVTSGGHRWVLLASTGIVYQDSTFVHPSFTTDSLYMLKNGTNTLIKIFDRNCGLISPGTVTYDSLFIFTVSPAIYTLCSDGIRRTSNLTSVTLAASDATFDRRDAIILNSSGVAVLTGTPAATPVDPQISPSQILLTYITVPAGAVNIPCTTITIYDENSGSEWPSTGSTGVTINVDNTTNPYHLTKAVNVGAFTTGNSFRWAGTGVTLRQYTYLKFHIRLKSAFTASNYLKLVFGTPAGNVDINILNGQYGFNFTTVGTYQTIIVPMSDWSTPTSAIAEQMSIPSSISLTFVTGGSNADGFYLDYIQLGGGDCIEPTPTTSNENFVQNVFRKPGTDSVFKVIGGVNQFAFRDSIAAYSAANLSGLGVGVYKTTVANVFQFKRLKAGTGITITDNTDSVTITNTGGTYTVTNGLYASPTATNFKLGGLLVENSTIYNNGFTLLLLGNMSSELLNIWNQGTGQGIYSKATSNTAVYALSNSSYGSEAESVSGIAGRFKLSGGGTDTTISPILSLFRSGSLVAPSTGYGISQDFRLRSATVGTDRLSNQIISRWSTATDASRTSQLDITGVNSATTETFANFQTGGIVIVNNLADTLATKAYARSVGGSGSSGITIGTTTVTSGTSTRVLYNNAGVVGEYVVSGTGNVALTTSPTFTTPILGTPTSVTLTNGTGLPISTGVSGLGTGVATFLATPSSANLISAVTDETGTGALVFATSPTFVTPILGTPTSGTLTNATGLPISTGVSGLGTGVATFLATPSSANLASAVTGETGTGALVFGTSPDFTTGATIGGVAIPTISSTNTLTNKRWTARVGSTTSSATPSINTDNVDIYKLTAQAANITSMSSSLSGTPVDGDILEVEFTGTGAFTLTWGASFVSTTVALPTAITTTTLTVVLQYFTTSSFGNNLWHCVNYF